MIVPAGHLTAVAIEDHHRRGSASALSARLAERVRREVGGVDGRGGHVRAYHDQGRQYAGIRASAVRAATGNRAPSPFRPCSA